MIKFSVLKDTVMHLAQQDFMSCSPNVKKRDKKGIQEITASLAIAKDDSINVAFGTVVGLGNVATSRPDQRMMPQAFPVGNEGNPDCHFAFEFNYKL